MFVWKTGIVTESDGGLWSGRNGLRGAHVTYLNLRVGSTFVHDESDLLEDIRDERRDGASQVGSHYVYLIGVNELMLVHSLIESKSLIDGEKRI
jgi:hypothetical protein